MAEIKEKIWEWPEHQQLEENPLKQQDGFQQLASHDVIILCFFMFVSLHESNTDLNSCVW